MHKSAFFKENHFSLIGGLFVLFRMDFFSIPAINEAYANIRVSSRFFVQAGHKTTYRISANSFRGNYSFLNLCLCTVTFDHSTYRCGNYSREETIQGQKLFAEIRYACDSFTMVGFIYTFWYSLLSTSSILE